MNNIVDAVILNFPWKEIKPTRDEVKAKVIHYCKVSVAPSVGREVGGFLISKKAHVKWSGRKTDAVSHVFARF